MTAALALSVRVVIVPRNPAAWIAVSQAASVMRSQSGIVGQCASISASTKPPKSSLPAIASSIAPSACSVEGAMDATDPKRVPATVLLSMTPCGWVRSMSCCRVCTNTYPGRAVKPKL
jgi:hypothetical protein